MPPSGPLKYSNNENVAIAPPSATLDLPSNLHRRTRSWKRNGVFQRTLAWVIATAARIGGNKFCESILKTRSMR